MADFRKVLDADNQIVWVNRDLVNAVIYLKEEKKTVFCFGGGPDDYIEIPGACPIFSDRGLLTMTDRKSCYGLCNLCVWKFNGGCSEWNRRVMDG